MPICVSFVVLTIYSECIDGRLYDITGFIGTNIDLDTEQKMVMYKRYTRIAGILPCAADEKIQGLSEQRLRSTI